MDIILCVACGGAISEYDDRLNTEYGDFHFECWLDVDEAENDIDDDDD